MTVDCASLFSLRPSLVSFRIVQSKIFWKDSINAGIVSCGWIFWFVSAESDVTPIPSIPQGIKWLNQLRSMLQFKAIPWVETQRLAWTPVQKEQNKQNWLLANAKEYYPAENCFKEIGHKDHICNTFYIKNCQQCCQDCYNLWQAGDL